VESRNGACSGIFGEIPEYSRSLYCIVDELRVTEELSISLSPSVPRCAGGMRSAELFAASSTLLFAPLDERNKRLGEDIFSCSFLGELVRYVRPA
jgi:hypothetical protein